MIMDGRKKEFLPFSNGHFDFHRCQADSDLIEHFEQCITQDGGRDNGKNSDLVEFFFHSGSFERLLIV